MKINAASIFRSVIIFLFVTLLFLLLMKIIYSRYEKHVEKGTLEVTITQGTLRGISMKTHLGRNISAFLGIPFGEPPIGSLRFAAPVPHKPWNGTLQATEDGPDCAQLLNKRFLGEEDCLRLNLYTPKLPRGNNSQLLPTMVFVFGGGFVFGSAASAKLGPHYLLDEDVLLVIPNYRLGPLGFMSTGDEVVSANNGFKDIVLAFEWIQQNIKFFGGDPTRITLFGHSSGAAAAHMLALSPLMKGLFHRYITQSGSAFANRAYLSKETCRERAFQLGEFVGCSTNVSSELVECLRKIQPHDIVSAQSKFQIHGHTVTSLWASTDEPGVKGAFLSDSPVNLVAAKKFPDIPWMTGIARDDGLIYSGNYYNTSKSLKDILEQVDQTLTYELIYYDTPIDPTAYIEELKGYYLNDLTVNRSVLVANVTRLMSDVFFFYPALYGIKRQANFANSPTYFYNFDYVGTFSLTYAYCHDPVVYGVAHADDLIYLYDLYHSHFEILNKSLSSTDLEMRGQMVSLWTSFANYGIPLTSPDTNDTIWKPYDEKIRNLLRIGNGSSIAVAVRNDFYDERMRFLDDLNSRHFNCSHRHGLYYDRLFTGE